MLYTRLMVSLAYLRKLWAYVVETERPVVYYKLGEPYKGAASGPVYATEGSAGCDLIASSPVVISPDETALVPTGLFVEIPRGYEMQVRSRSGMTLKRGLIVLNSPGTIDSDYRGEVKVILRNMSRFSQMVEAGDAIAQGVFARAPRARFVIRASLSKSTRGEGGFGSTGERHQNG